MFLSVIEIVVEQHSPDSDLNEVQILFTIHRFNAV